MYARMRQLERKEDTRRKIQLGGLIKKAGLATESTAVLLGLLLEARELLDSGQSEETKKRWQLMGDILLTEQRRPSD